MNRDRLLSSGIDYDEGIKRFSGKEEVYQRYLNKFFSSTTFDSLIDELEKKNFTRAFCIAHDLKGASGNLSLNSLYKAMCELVEVLRQSALEGAVSEELEEVKKIYYMTKSIILEEIN